MAVFTTAQRLMQLGVATPLAQEMGKQLDTGVYNVFRLIELGMVPGLAKIFITQPFNRVKAVELGMIPAIATLVAGGGVVPVPDVVSLPAGAGTPVVAVFARKMIPAFAGTSLIQVKKGGDAGTTFDVPILANGTIDNDAAMAFAAGAEMRISIGYNQGSGINYVPVDWASMPIYDPAGLYGNSSKYGAFFSFVFDGWFQSAGTIRRVKWGTFTLSQNRQSTTVFDVMDPKSALYNSATWGAFVTATPTVTSLGIGTVATNPGLYVSGFTDDLTTRRPKQNMQVIGVDSGAAADKVFIDGQNISLAVKGSTTLNGINWGVGASGSAGTTDFLDSSNHLGFLVYPTALSDVNAAAVRDAINSSFGLGTTFDNQIVGVGDSILFGGTVTTGLEGRNPLRVAAPKLRGRNAIYNMGLSSQLLTGGGSLATNAATREDLLAVDGTYTGKRVLVIQIGSNDLGVNGGTPGFSTTLYQALTTYVSGRRAAGYNKIIVCTILPAASTGSGQPLTEYLAYNNLIRANGVGADGILDLASHPIMGVRGNTGNTLYYQDSLHPTGLGYTLVGGSGDAVGGNAVNYADAINLVLSQPATRALQAASMRNEVDRSPGAATTSANLKQVCRVRDYFGSAALARLRLSLCSFYVTDSTTLETAGAQFTARADIEIAGVCIPVTFDGGATSKVVNSGAVDIQTDDLLPSQFGLTEFPAGGEFYVKMEREYLAGVIPTYETLNAAIPAIPGELTLRAPTGTATKIGTAGAMAAGGGWLINTTAIFKPLILGVPKAAMPAVLVAGASIEFSTADTEGDGVNGAGGYARLGLASGIKLAGMNMGKSGDSAFTFMAGGNNTLRVTLFKYFNVGVNCYGGNDFSDTRAIATTVTNMASINALMKAAGIVKIAQMINFVKSTSSDSWVTTANQTVAVNGNGTLLDYRNACLAGADVNRNSFIDLRGAMEAAPSIWKAPPAYTADGIHPNSAMHNLMATPFRQQIDSLIAS